MCLDRKLPLFRSHSGADPKSDAFGSNKPNNITHTVAKGSKRAEGKRSAPGSAADFCQLLSDHGRQVSEISPFCSFFPQASWSQENCRASRHRAPQRQGSCRRRTTWRGARKINDPSSECLTGKSGCFNVSRQPGVFTSSLHLLLLLQFFIRNGCDSMGCTSAGCSTEQRSSICRFLCGFLSLIRHKHTFEGASAYPWAAGAKTFKQTADLDFLRLVW